jgi:hypothetical protein
MTFDAGVHYGSRSTQSEPLALVAALRWPEPIVPVAKSEGTPTHGSGSVHHRKKKQRAD